MHTFKHTKPPVGGGKSLNKWVIVSFNRFVQNAESFSSKTRRVLLGEYLILRLWSLFGTIFVVEIEQKQ